VARIVVADNDLDALDLALTDLRLEGHDVFGALDAADAEDLVDRVDPDVVVLDYRMPPGITGLELADDDRTAVSEVDHVWGDAMSLSATFR
jgi:DNA-binding response OmpR family regulator